MAHFEDEIRSKDGTRLFFQGWVPQEGQKAVVCLVHGLGEHSGRYGHVGEAFNHAGYGLLAIDLRGHGRSEGKRGHFQNAEAVLEDLDSLLREAELRQTGMPRFLYGHSMGGILALYYSVARKPALQGVVATSSGLRTALEGQKLKLALHRALKRGSSRYDPGHRPGGSGHLARTGCGADLPGRSAGSRSSHVWVGEIPAERHPLCLRTCRRIPCPIASRARRGGSHRLRRGSQEYARLAPNNCTLKIWDGLYHETHNEPEKEQVLAFTIQWLDRQLAVRSAPLDKPETPWQNSA